MRMGSGSSTTRTNHDQGCTIHDDAMNRRRLEGTAEINLGGVVSSVVPRAERIRGLIHYFDCDVWRRLHCVQRLEFNRGYGDKRGWEKGADTGICL